MSGALLSILEFESFPYWMPMCQAADVLRRWSPGEQLVRLEFRLPVIHLRLEFLIYCRLVNRLDEEGFLELLLCSPGGAAAGAFSGAGRDPGSPPADERRPFKSAPCFLGVQIPARRRLVARSELDCGSLRIYPAAGNSLQQRARFVLQSEERCPVDTVISMIWRMLSRNLIPILAKYATGSHQQDMSPAKFAFYAELERGLLAASRRAAAAPVPALSPVPVAGSDQCQRQE